MGDAGPPSPGDAGPGRGDARLRAVTVEQRKAEKWPSAPGSQLCSSSGAHGGEGHKSSLVKALPGFFPSPLIIGARPALADPHGPGEVCLKQLGRTAREPGGDHRPRLSEDAWGGQHSAGNEAESPDCLKLLPLLCAAFKQLSLQRHRLGLMMEGRLSLPKRWGGIGDSREGEMQLHTPRKSPSMGNGWTKCWQRHVEAAGHSQTLP